MVRYADDFKIFCRNRADAERIFIATKDWLRCRLGLEISPEKSRIVNLRKQYSEFLGFRLKLHRKGKMPNGTAKYTVRSRMSDKAKRKVLAKARVALKAIEFPSDAEMEYRCIQKYNAMVMGWHNYYAFATMASMDFARLAFSIERRIRARLGKRVRKRRPNDHIGKQYGRYRNSAQIRFVNGTPLLPLGYVKHKTPMDKRRSINKYTPEGRAEIHSHLLAVDTLVLHYLMRNPAPDRSIQYNDNRLALYCAQMGKCAVTHRPLKPLNIHCHHKIASCDGGTDDYSNLILVDAAVHKLLHAVHHKVIEARLKMVNLDAAARRKLNELRLLLNLNPV